LKKTKVLIVLVMGVFCSSLFADQVVLKNGDRLSGTVIKFDAKNLVIKTDYAGEVSVDWSAVQEMTSTQSLHVVLKSGQTVVGPLSVKEGKLEVTTKDFGTVEAPRDNVVVIRDDAGQLAYDKSLHPGFLQGWNGGLNLGFAVTRGNSETKNLNIAFNSARTGLHDKLTLYTNSIYSTNDLSTANPHTTANQIGGGLRYDRDFSKRVFWFGSGDFFHNSLQYLDLRSSFGGGIGLHAIKKPVTTLDLLAGLNYTHESYSGIPNLIPPPPTLSYSKSYPALVLGDSFTHKLGKSTDITQSFFVYPDLSDTSQYRFTFNAGTVTKLNKWLGWQNSFGDVYVTSPLRPAGTKANDLQLSTGINISFTH
jgi:hypothetical protein